MALVGNISGSSQSSSLIAFSGSAIFGKRPDGLFPQMPGSDVVWFVSGSSGSDKASFGGDLVVSGTLTAAALAFSSADISGNLSVGGTLGVTGVATFANDIAVNGGDLTSTAATFNLLNSAVTTLNIGGGASTATNIGHASGLTTIAGDIKIAGNDIQSSTASALTLSGADVAVLGELAVAGDLTVTGNDIKSSGGTTALTLSGADVTIAGNLTVNGTTTTVNSTTLTVDDKNIELGSTASPTDAAADGGGITLKGDTDHTIIWRDSQNAWEFSEHLVPNGSLDLGLTGDRWRNMFLSGDGSITGDLAVNGGNLTSSAATFNLLNSGVTTLNLAGAATSLLVGATACGMAVGGVNSPSSTITAATGSFGSVLASSTSTFTGATTHNGGIAASGITTTTLSASGAAQLTSTLAVTGISTFTGQTVHNGAIDANSTSDFQGAMNLQAGITVAGAAVFNGAVTLGDASADVILANGVFGSNLIPSSDRGFNLGSPSARWNNIYTGDLHLRNERGNWTVVEEESYLSIRNNVSGKMFKFVLEEISLPDSVE